MNVHLSDCGREASGLKERSDCTVRATAMCLDVDYKVAHKMLEDLGRKHRQGVKFWKLVDNLGLERRADLSCRTLEKILPEMQTGRFIVRIARHVFAVVDGVVVDMGEPQPKCRVKMVYQKL